LLAIGDKASRLTTVRSVVRSGKPDLRLGERLGATWFRRGYWNFECMPRDRSPR